MTGTAIRPRYGQSRLQPYLGDNNRLVSPVQQQMSKAFRNYLESRKRIDEDRRIHPLERVVRKLHLLDRTIVDYEGNLSRVELNSLATDNTKLLAITEAYIEAAKRIRDGEATDDLALVYLHHTPLSDFVGAYTGSRRKLGGAILEEILSGRKPELYALLVEEPTMSGRHEMVIPAKNLPEFRTRFESYFKQEAGIVPIEPKKIKPEDEMSSEEAKRLIKTSEWPADL